MDILIDARLYGLENTGVGRYLINLIDNLGQIDKENIYTVLLSRKYYKSLKLPLGWKKVRVTNRHYTLAGQIELHKIIRESDPDLCHFPHFNVPYFYKSSYVVTLHDMEMHKSREGKVTTLNPIVYAVKRIAYKEIFRKAVNYSQRVFVPSGVIKNVISEHFGVRKNKFVVTYEGIEQVFSQKQGRKTREEIMEKYGLKGKDYFLYWGNVYPHKNLELAFLAVRLASKKAGKRLILACICKDSELKSKLISFVQSNELDNYVAFHPPVPDRELVVLLSSSLGLTYPSLNEGFGLQGLEAMAAGTLVAASDIPIFKEIYQDSAFYFDPKDERSIAKALSDLATLSPKIRGRLLKESSKFVEKYSWRDMAVETLKVYNSLGA